MENWFFVLAGVLVLAAIGGVVAKLAKQPPILGYIGAGILFNLAGGGRLPEVKMFLEGMGQIGVTLLLFLAGLELPLAELKKMGKVSLVVGITQISITAVLGFLLNRALGFNPLISVYLGIGMAFGSTILVVKLLSEKGDLQSLHGKIAMGFLLVQDFVAIGLLLIAGGPAVKQFIAGDYLAIILKSVLMVGIAVWLSEKVMGKITGFFGKSTELVFIGAVGWCLLCAALVSLPVIGFTKEIGGFLAGLALAGAMEQAQIISRVRPLRDFFLTWFFVSMGTTLTLRHLEILWLPVTIISAYVILINPLIVTAILGRLGYKRRTAFLASLGVSQMSEFSLILISRAGLGQEAVTVVTLVMMLTMAISTYLIWNSNLIYKKLDKFLKLFERKSASDVNLPEVFTDHVILFGHNRVGGMITPVLDKMGIKVVIVDFNPAIIEKLTDAGKAAIYGDVADHELYDRLGIAKAKMIISTVPDYYDNLELLGELKMKPKKRPYIILTASDQDDANRLYKSGADFVLVPHSVGGEYLADYLKHHWHE